MAISQIKAGLDEVTSLVAIMEQTQTDVKHRLAGIAQHLADLTKRQEEDATQLQAALTDNNALRACNRELADDLSRLTQSHQALTEESRTQGGKKHVGAGTTWQYCVNADWIDMPGDCALELTRRYLVGTNGGGDVASKFNYRSGAEWYEFDLTSMLQHNVRTRTQRAIRCVVDCPRHWSRCTNISEILRTSTVQTKTVELSGFDNSTLNGVYVESGYDSYNGKPVWWKHDGTRFILWYRKEERWHLCTIYCDYLQVRNGSGCRVADCYHEPDHAGPWDVGDDDATTTNDVRVSMPALGNSIPPLMNIVVELLDKPMREWFNNLLHGTVFHHQSHTGDSQCDNFRDSLKIVRVLRVENWHLLQKYRIHKHMMKQDLAKYRINPGAVEPRLPDLLNTALDRYGGGDAEINECVLFHGTSSETATRIAQEGFDFRMARAGYYGRGTYFASQSCKSFQYTGDDRTNMHTIIVSRVALGDIFYAKEVNRECQRPEIREGTLRCHDSIVANPGPMLGHIHGHQSHQEFVIFEKFQAYPEFLVQFSGRA